jgi:hypothetical protein
MSESLSVYPNNEARSMQAAAQIGKRALQNINETYGSGMPLWTPGSHPLAYHNGCHALQTADDTDKMGEAFGFQKRLRAINRGAALSHDKDQLQGPGLNEESSARWYRNELEQTKLFTAEETYIGWLDIIGTKVIIDDKGTVAAQQADLLEYPSREAELSAKSLACADLGTLWRPEGPLFAHRYLQELKGPNPTHEQMVDFQRRQVELLETYNYPLQQANTVLATHRSEVTNYVQQTLDGLEAGTIPSLKALIVCDKQLIYRCEG